MSDTTKIKGGIQLEAVDIGTISNPKNNSIVLDSNDNKLKKYNESLDLWEEIASGVVCSGPTPVVFNIANDQSTEANITGLIIDVNEATTFDLEYVIRRSTDDNSVSQKGVFSGVYDLNDSVWYKSDTFAGLNAGVDFFIDNSTGQISYTSTEITGANYTGSISYVLKTNKSCSINIDGDVTGALGQTKVEAIQNVPVPAPTAGDDGKVLVYNDISGEFEYDDIFDGAVVINESGADVDFRVESDTNVNALFVKGSSGNVGIGTNNPANCLTVQEASADQLRLQDHVGNGYEIRCGTDFTIKDDGTERMRITSAGNVGIGTASPGSRLDVVGATAYDSAATFRSNTAANNWARIDIKNHNVATPAILYQDQAGTFAIRTDAAYPITFATNGANERMRIGSSGNVGIGTSSPSARLDITADALGNTAGNERLVYRSTINTGNNDQLDMLYRRTTSTSGWVNADLIIRRNVDSTASQSQIVLGGGNFTSFWTGAQERMRIDSSGNVGIGTSSPNGRLSLQGNGTAPALVVDGVSRDIGFAGDLQLGTWDGTSWSERMRITSAGNVGIGTASPGSRLDVSGDITVRGAGLGFPTVATTWGRSPNAIGFTWSSPNIYATVDNVVETIIGTVSDYRLKANSQPLTDGLDTILALRPITYNPVDFDGSVNETKQELGLVAHEVQAIRPSVVSGQKDAVNENGKSLYQSVNYAGLVPDLIKAIQEQQEQINELKAEIAVLKGS